MKRLLFSIVTIFIISYRLLAVSPPSVLDIHIAKYKGDKVCAVSYTFDDGLIEHYTLVYPMLEQLGFKGTFWVSGNRIQNKELQRGVPPMTWEQLKEMTDHGHEISSHGWSHKNMTKLSPENIKSEIWKNDSIIFEKTGVFPQTFCYPGNARNDTVESILSAQKIATRTYQRSIGSKSTDKDLENWIKKLRKEQGWGVGMTHGITYGYDAFKDSSILWNHLKQVKEQEDSIWVATFRSVAAYIKERDHTILEIKNISESEIIILPNLSLDKSLFTTNLTMLIDKKEVKDLTVKQGGRKLDVQIYPDKAVFDFDPYGGYIQIKIEQ